MRVLLIVLVLGCATEPDEDLGPTAISKSVTIEYSRLPGQQLSTIGSPCGPQRLAEPHDCSVSMFIGVEESIVPVCGTAETDTCWRVVTDSQECGRLGKLEVAPPQPIAIYVRAQCVSR